MSRCALRKQPPTEGETSLNERGEKSVRWANTDGFVHLSDKLMKSAHLMVSTFPVQNEEWSSVEDDSDGDGFQDSL